MAKSIVEQVIDTVFAKLPAQVVKVVGRRELEAHAKSYRVVAIPLGAPEVSQPNMRAGDPRAPNYGRALLMRWFNIEWVCHGARGVGDTNDFAAAEALYLDTIQAVRFACHNAVTFANERWIDQEPEADGYERFGSVISFISTIQIPIYEERSRIVSLTADPKIVTTATLNGE